MLVLTRKKDQSIVINNDIRIVVVEIRGDKVRLGIEAPKEVPVHRHEVFDAIADMSGSPAPADHAEDSIVPAAVAVTSAAAGDEPTSEAGMPLRPR